MTVGERIREKRRALGISMAELGKILGISAAAVSRYELGQRQIKLEMLKKIAIALNVPVNELFDDDASFEKEHANYLVETYERGVKIWINDKAFSEREKTRLAQHYSDLLLRYKRIINSFVDAKYSLYLYDDISDELTRRKLKGALFRENANKFIDDLRSWIDCMPEYIAETQGLPPDNDPTDT